MKIVFNTSQPTAPCSEFYSSALSTIEQMTFYDNQLQNYDIGLFMTYDHEILKHVKEKYPSLKIGLIDPRSHRVKPNASYADFLVIDSIEMEDYWRIAQKPMFKYVEYPNIETVEKTHKKKEKILIGYHGNQIHLECMAHNVTPALSALGQKYDLELVVMHNGAPPQGHESWFPQEVEVCHVPWSMDNYTQELSKCDIGIVPNNMVHDTSTKHLTKTSNNFNYSVDDYSLRFKMPSNPGRFVIFGKLGIPVIADFYPSALQYLQNGTGFVAHNPQGWYHCLEELIKSHELRQDMGNSLQNLIKTKFDFGIQNEKFITFLKTL